MVQPGMRVGLDETPAQVPPQSLHSVHPSDIWDSGVKTVSLVCLSRVLNHWITVAVFPYETVTEVTRWSRGQATWGERMLVKNAVPQKDLA